MIILVLHGFKSSSGHPALVSIVKGLQAHGFRTESLDFSKEATIDIRKQVEEITDKIKALNEDVVLLAGSFGALSASIAVRVSPNTVGLVTINGFFGSGKLNGPRHRRTYRTFKLLAKVSPKHRRIMSYFKRELQPEQIRVPVLVIHSSVDEIVAYEGSETFYGLLETPKVFKTLNSANHNLTNSEDVTMIIAWTSSWLSQLSS